MSLRMYLAFLVLVACGEAFRTSHAGRKHNSSEPNIPQSERQEEECEERDSCFRNGRLNWSNTSELSSRNLFLRNCFCDSLCWAYGDCCSDVIHGVNSRENPWSSPLPSKLDQDTFECASGATKNLTILDNLYLVVKCPVNWANETVRVNCEDSAPSDLLLNIPVTDDNGVVYQNKFCALCHEAGDTTYWHVGVECDMALTNVSSEVLESVLTKQLDTGPCSTHFQPPLLPIKFRPCKKLVNFCPDTWSDPDACEHGEHRYVYERRMTTMRPFKNPACAQCHNVSHPICTDYDSYVMRSEDGMPYPLSFMLDINTQSGESTGYRISGRMHTDDFDLTVGNTESCEENHVYRVLSQKCRSLVCPEGYSLIDEQCTPGTNSPKLACPMIRLNSSEFTILHGSDLYVNDTGEIHAPGTYQLEGKGSAYICTKVLTSRLREAIDPKFSSTQTIVSVIGQVISIVCLSLHLLVYSMFRKLRNLPGLNIMSLSACLLIAQLLFLFAGSVSVSYSWCFTIGVLVHYFFLASFLWMNVMAFDICRTFVKFSKPSLRDDYSSKFIRYCAYCILVALVIVLSAIVANFTLGDSLYRPGYGEGICWIKNRKALLAFFAAPVAVIVTSNLVYFFITLWSIQKSMEASKMAAGNKKGERDRFWLYVKLSTIMGLTWVFGFVAAIFDVEVLWYLFIIFNSLQGAMICFAFVMTKQVLSLLRGKFSKEPRSQTEMASSGVRSSSKELPSPEELSVFSGSSDERGFEVKGLRFIGFLAIVHIYSKSNQLILLMLNNLKLLGDQTLSDQDEVDADILYRHLSQKAMLGKAIEYPS
ncbi:hypothetical protein CAPTEDRAFT_208644 [Capitella teleta]|uniref:G-protein coupled receptors family 2 profile 2 domain-containing protein n=1 Tax=Capitella teleta TaxID=283909 RepID=R7TZV2_CAPTE|nr:hypothetical protein CAPTEDRAFT_208644 [Capitella teleta]|eukprot:ELT99274.1 hypothetical protein CAPTEDRAFT_208644 [Capitella teleta]